MGRPPVALLAPLLLLAPTPLTLEAQGTPYRIESEPMVLERNVTDRWIFDGQHPDWVEFHAFQDWIHLRAMRTRSPVFPRELDLNIYSVEARLRMDEAGRIYDYSIEIPEGRARPGLSRENRADRRRERLPGPGATLNLPEARFWHVPFVLPPDPLARGLTWSDSVVHVADPGEGLFQQLTGLRKGHVVGDTTINGRRLPLVRTETAVVYESTEPIRDYAVEGLMVVRKEASGSITGWAAVDTVLGVRVAGVDSMEWEGSAILSTQDGRAFPSPVRYEGVRTWTLHDSVEWAVLEDSIRTERRRQSRGMVRLPATPLEERLAQGDSLLADSMMKAWKESTDPGQRQELFGVLNTWGQEAGLDWRALRDMDFQHRLEAGDTAGVVRGMITSFSTPLTAERLSFLRPYLDDLGQLWRLGVRPQLVYILLAEDLLGSGPIVEPDSSKWDCTPEACRQLIAWLDTAQEPRLRDVALVGAFARDPLAWIDSVQARAEEGSLSARTALNRARGSRDVGSYSQPILMPGPGAHWREWSTWMGGGFTPFELDPSYRHAMRLYAAYSGQNPLDELRAAWPPEGDSARAVIGAILRGMDALPPPTVEQLVADVLSDSGARKDAAMVELRRRLGSGAVIGGPDLIQELVPPLVESLLFRDHGPVPWEEEAPDTARARTPPPPRANRRQRFVLDENLPRGIESVLRDEVELISEEAWDRRPLREAASLLTISLMRVEGPFVALTWSFTSRSERAPDQPPSGGASGGTRYLLRTEDGWMDLGAFNWIT